MIFDAALQRQLFTLPGRNEIREEFPWQPHALIRHDEHDHIDFAIR